MLHSLRWKSTRLLIEWPWVRGFHFVPVRAKRGPPDHSTPQELLWLQDNGSPADCGSAYGGARCPGDICSAPTEAERRPIPPGHPMDGYAQWRGQRTVNPSQRNTAGSSPAPSTFRLCVREVYGASPFHFGRRKADVPRIAAEKPLPKHKKSRKSILGFPAWWCYCESSSYLVIVFSRIKTV